MSKEAMKLALEALRQIDEAMPFPVAKLAQYALREALAEQPAQQEPVAFCVYCDGQFTHNICHSENLANFRAAALEEKYPRYKRTVVPLYESPPQRTWVSLTDDEMRALKQKNIDDGITRIVSDFEYIRSIEAKLKEKNT